MGKRFILIIATIAATISALLIKRATTSDFDVQLRRYTEVNFMDSAADSVCSECPPNCVPEDRNN